MSERLTYFGVPKGSKCTKTKWKVFWALAQSGDSTPHSLALVYANLPQPETLSPNQWIFSPERGLGGCMLRNILCGCTDGCILYCMELSLGPGTFAGVLIWDAQGAEGWFRCALAKTLATFGKETSFGFGK